MRILFLCDFTGNLGNAIRISRIYEYLTKGNDVKFDNVALAYNPKVKLLLHPDVGARILRHMAGHDNRVVTELDARMMLATKIVEKAVRTWKPDMIWCENTVAAVASIRSVGRSVPVITDMHSAPPAEYAGEVTGPGGPDEETIRYLKEMEQLIYSYSSTVIIVSSPMKDYVVATYGVSPDKLWTIPNGSDVRDERAKYREPHRVIYGGIFAAWEDPDSYLDLADRNRRCEFYLAGNGPLEKHVLGRIWKERIPIHYLGSLDYAKAIASFATMTVGVAPSADNLTRRVACPVKIFDYLSCGLPVITPNVGEWAKVISANKCGFVTKASDAEEFDQCLSSLDRRTWEEMSANGLRLIEKEYNWNKLLRGIDEILHACS